MWTFRVKDYLETHKVQQRIQNLIQDPTRVYLSCHRVFFLMLCLLFAMCSATVSAVADFPTAEVLGRMCCEKLQMIRISAPQ